MERIKKIFLAFTTVERILVIGALIIITGASGALLAGYLNQSTTVVPARGGDYTEGFVGQPASVNPVLATTEVDKSIVRLVFANVTELAEKIEPSEDGRTWKIRLKENLLWDNGKKITSDDIIFTVQKIQDPETRSPLFTRWQGVVANRLSELELQFNLAAPYPFFMENIEDLYPIPKHLFAETPPANWRLSQYLLKPVGSGAYVIDSVQNKQDGFIVSYSLSARSRSYAPEAHIQNLVLDFFPNQEALLQAFNTATIDGFGDMNPELIGKINRPYQLFQFSMPNYYAVFFNQGQNLALKEPEVRRAMNLAIHRTELIQKIFAGRATPLNSPLAFQIASATPSSTTPEAILEGDGWKMSSDGVREKTIKTSVIRLEINLSVPAVPFLVATAKELATIWGNLGIRVNIATLSSQEIDSALKNRTYQAILFGNILNPHSDLYSFWHSNERFYPGLNLSLYNQKGVDTALENLRHLVKPEERASALQKTSDMIAKDDPAVFLFSAPYLMIANRELKGVPQETISQSADRFAKVTDWHLRTTRTFK